MLALGFLLGIVLASRRARARSLHPDLIVDVGLIALVSALVGARALHVALHPEQFVGWRDAVALSGGLSMYGGVLAAIGACWVYARWRQVPFLTLADVAATSIAVGHGVTRIGCFLNGCCYGRPTTGLLGVSFPPGSHADVAFGGAALHPTQLYTSALAFSIVFVLLAFERKPRGAGHVFGLFLALEGIGRFGMDFVRAPEQGSLVWGVLTAHQLIALGLLAAGLLLLARSAAPAGLPATR